MLSVLIVNWNTRDLLRACLASLRQHPYPAMEVIVVDNASKDGSAEMVEAEFPEFRLIRAGGNVGYAVGNNLAMAAAKGDWLLTLNPDTEVHADTLKRAVSRLEELPEYGALGAKQVHPDEGVQPSVRGFPTYRGILGDLLGLKSAGWDSYRLRNFDYTKDQDAPQPMGTFLLFRRETLSPFPKGTDGPFDPQFPIFFNEVDLLYRLAQKGWKCRYCPEVVVTHFGGMSTRQAKKKMIWESHRALVRFFQKHHPSLLVPLVGAVVWLAACVRARGYDVGFRPEHPNL